MIYTSGTNRILTINEADNTKVGWAADNTTSNGKLVFSDADVNWEHNYAAATTQVQLKYVERMNYPSFRIMDFDTGNFAELTRPSYDTYVFTSGMGGICFFKKASNPNNIDFTYVTPNSLEVTMYSSDANQSWAYESTVNIPGTKRPVTVVRRTLTNELTFKSPVLPEGSDPSASSNTITYSYSPSPVLSVSQTKPTTYNPISTNTYWSGNMTVYIYYIPWGTSTPVYYGATTFECQIYSDGNICTTSGTTKSINIPTRYGSSLVLFTLNRNYGSSYKTGRFYGDTTTSRSTGYAGTATVTANETGSASITQTS